MRNDTKRILDTCHDRKTRNAVLGASKRIARVERSLAPGESVCGLTTGGANSRNLGLIVITDQRLLWDTQEGIVQNVPAEDIAYAGVSEVDGQMWLQVRAEGAGEFEFALGMTSLFGGGRLQKGERHLLDQIQRQAGRARASASNQPAGGGSAAAEIEHLASQLERGLITRAEFEAGKRRALGT